MLLRNTISEVVCIVNGIIYDTNNWILDINVIDNGDGTLGISKTIDGNTVYFDEYFSEKAPLHAETSATFTNKYTTSLSFGIKLSKELLGRELNELDSFSFNLYHAEGSISNPCDPHNALGSHTNLEHLSKMTLNNITSFNIELQNAIKVHNIGTYYVSIIEDVPANAKMKYDSSVYVMVIKTEQDGNDIKTSDGYPKYYKAPDKDGWDSKDELNTNEFKFVNKTTVLSVQKQVVQYSLSKEFEFELTLKNSLNNPIKNASFHATINDTNYGITTDENGKASFKLKGNQTLVLADLPDGTKYELKELNSPESKTTIVVKENGASKPLVEGKSVSDVLEAGVHDLVVVKNVNIDPGSNDDRYIVPDTGCGR